MILLVDDDQAMLQTYSDLLTHSGLQVSAHSCPHLAFKNFRMNPEVFQAVLTDYNMPTMNGLELITSIHAICPHLKAILYSGMLPQHVPDDIITFSKPTRIKQLLEVLTSA